MFDAQASLGHIAVELRECIPAIDAEADDDESVGGQDPTQIGQDFHLGSFCQKCQHVASDYDRIEWLALGNCGQSQLRQIGDDPLGFRVILSGGGNERRIGINSHYLVAALGEDSADPAGPAARIQYPRVRSGHSVDKTSLASQIRALSGERPEAIDVPLGMTLVGIGLPLGGFDHVVRLSEPQPSRGYAIRHYVGAFSIRNRSVS